MTRCKNDRFPSSRVPLRLVTPHDAGFDEFSSDDRPQHAAPGAARHLDRRTNPIVDELRRAHPQLFAGWAPTDFDDLYSRFGTGGELTWDGAVAFTTLINRRRKLLAQVALLAETAEVDRLETFLDELYREVVLVMPTSAT